MVKWLKRKFIEFFNDLVANEELACWNKLDDNIAGALIALNQLNDKIDTRVVNTDAKIKELEDKLEVHKPIDLEDNSIIEEWFNGKEVDNE